MFTLITLAVAAVVAVVLSTWAVTARCTFQIQKVGSTGGGITLGSASFDQTAEGGPEIDLSISANQTNLQIDLAFTLAGLNAIIILASQDMTLETNNSSTPDDTIALKANRTFAWVKDTGVPNPFTENVTTGYVTNTTAGTLKIWVFKDMTP